MQFDIKKHTIAFHLRGSQAYGLNTESSDYDMSGIFIPPKEYLLGFLNKIEQHETKDPNNEYISLYKDKIDINKKQEIVNFAINKFLRLSSECNPNMIEILWVEDEDFFLKKPEFEKIQEIRDCFLSKKARFTFSGYAYAQIKRIKNHRQYFLSPPTKKPERSDYNLPDIKTSQYETAEALIKSETEHWAYHDLEISPEIADAIRERTTKQLAYTLTALNLPEIDLFNEKDIRKAAMNKIGFDENLCVILDKEHIYRNDLKHYNQYLDWKKNRNPERAAMEEKYHIDCYAEETEFLTNNGWKSFNEISENDLLATVFINETEKPMHRHPEHLGVEYQKPIEKFESLFTGNLYNLYGNHIDVLVTPNHRMLFRKVERSSKKKYNLVLEEISKIQDTFEIVRNITPKTKNYTDKKYFENIPIPECTFLRLMGWYLSDGYAIFKDNEKKLINSVRISQNPKGKLSQSLTKFYNKYKSIGCCLYIVNKAPNIFRKMKTQEMILDVRNKTLSEKIINDCGFLKDKRIPRWVFNLSKMKMESLLDAMIKGDGTISRPDNGIIYYSFSKLLADDVQELSFLCGFETSLYGPYSKNPEKNMGYDTPMYHVHINKTRDKFKECIRNKNIKKIKFENKKVVCFSVPNGTLITRFNGHIGIHGNCKHASHVVRLLRMGEEILSQGKVIVKRRDDRDELLAIKNGAWSYDKLMEYTEGMQSKLEDLYKTSSLRKSPDIEKIDALCVKLTEEHLKNE